MSISSSSDYTLTRNTIITRALNLLGVMSPEDSLSSNDALLCNDFLNMIVKAWEAEGPHVWSTSMAILWLVEGQSSYSLGSATSDANWANTFVETTLASNLAASATAVTATTTTGMTVGDKIGIVEDSGSVYWTTIATIPTSTTLTLTLGPNSVAASGNYIYTYTSRPTQPIRIQYCARRSSILTDTVDIGMYPLSFKDYNRLSNKFITSSPTQYMYQAKTGSGTLTLYPTPDDSNQRLYIQYQRQLFDFDSATDNSDMPTEWLMCLVYTLAAAIAAPYGQADKVTVFEAKAQQLFRSVNTYDQEKTSLFISPTLLRRD